MKNTPAATVATAVFTPFARLLPLAGPALAQRLLNQMGDMLAASGISLTQMLERTVARVPQRASVEVLEAAVVTSGDPALGLHAAEAAAPGDWELVEYLVRTSATVGAALEVWRRYSSLTVDADFEIIREGKMSWGHLRFAPDLMVTRTLIDYALVGSHLITVRCAPAAKGLPFELHFTHQAPSYVSEYERILGFRPRFGMPHNAIGFGADYEAVPMRDADPVLHMLLKRQADEELKRIQRHRSFTERVREAIRRTLPKGAPLNDVARVLGLSPGTLRRRIAEHGTSYRVLLEQIRRDVAVRALEAQEQSVSEIAFALGFNHTSAFDRAFRRWYGRAPSDYRNESVNQALTLFERKAAAASHG